jgi:arylsulfatase A-like enzyme
MGVSRAWSSIPHSSAVVRVSSVLIWAITSKDIGNNVTSGELKGFFDQNLKGRAMLARYLTVLVALALASCSTSGQISDATGADGQKPNIIFIMVDDMGWGDVGYHGSEIATPNIDKLAKSGLIIDRAYSFPICSPTRAALMTGRNPLQYGIDGPLENDAMLPLQLKVLPEYLRDGGYKTWMVGKWHLGMASVDAMPQSRGFDSFYGHLGGFIDYYTHVYLGGLDWQRDGKSLREKGYSTDLLTREAIKLLSGQSDDKPFFMYLSYNAPHTPLQYPPETDGTYGNIKNSDRRVYAQMLTYLDTSIGSILDKLKERNLAENTIIIFMSDNGGLLTAGASNGKLRAGKGSAFEGGVRVPAIISWPGKIKPATMTKTPMFVQDWLPTLLEATNINHDSHGFDGMSNWSAIFRNQPKPRAEPVILGTVRSKAVYQWPYKLVREADAGSATAQDRLFNISIDPEEKNDISGSNSDMTRKLAARIDAMPLRPSKGNKGPPPESLFKGPDGKFLYDIRMPETREPWADAATRVSSEKRSGS